MKKSRVKEASVLLRFESAFDGFAVAKSGAYFCCMSPIRRFFPEVADDVNNGKLDVRFVIRRPGDVRGDALFHDWIIGTADDGVSTPVDRLIRRLGVRFGRPLAWRVEPA